MSFTFNRCVCASGTVEDGNECVEAITPDPRTMEKTVSTNSVPASIKGGQIHGVIFLIKKIHQSSILGVQIALSTPLPRKMTTKSEHKIYISMHIVIIGVSGNTYFHSQLSKNHQLYLEKSRKNNHQLPKLGRLDIRWQVSSVGWWFIYKYISYLVLCVVAF